MNNDANITDTDGTAWQLITHNALAALLVNPDDADAYALAVKYRGIDVNTGKVKMHYGTVENFAGSIEDAFDRHDAHTVKLEKR